MSRPAVMDYEDEEDYEEEETLSTSGAARAGLRHIAELAGKEPSGVVSLEPAEDGWVVGVEVIEDVAHRTDLSENRGVRLHAVARDLEPGHLAGLRGVGGEPVRTVEAAGLVAFVSSVNLDEFGEQPLRRNLEDLAWLEVIARDHHRVIEAVARLGPVVPMRLATVYRDDSRVGSALALRRADFTAALRRVAGRNGVSRPTQRPASRAPSPAVGPEPTGW